MYKYKYIHIIEFLWHLILWKFVQNHMIQAQGFGVVTSRHCKFIDPVAMFEHPAPGGCNVGCWKPGTVFFLFGSHPFETLLDCTCEPICPVLHRSTCCRLCRSSLKGHCRWHFRKPNGCKCLAEGWFVLHYMSLMSPLYCRRSSSLSPRPWR